MLNLFTVEKPHLTFESCSNEKRRRCEHTHPVPRQDDLVPRDDAKKLGMGVKERWGFQGAHEIWEYLPLQVMIRAGVLTPNSRTVAAGLQCLRCSFLAKRRAQSHWAQKGS